MIIFFASFWLALAAYYPGNVAYDFGVQVRYYFGSLEFSRHHPPLHSYLVFLAIDFGTKHGVFAGTVYAWIQITMFSFILACCITYLLRFGIRIWWIIIIGAYYVINPVIAIFSIIPIKDVLFSAFFLLSTVLLIELCKKPDEMINKKGFCIAFCSSALLCCLFRNNGFAAIFFAGIVAVVVFRKHWKKMVLLFSIPIICFILIDKLIFGGLLGIVKTESEEALSVPIQQISAAVYEHRGDLTEEDIEFVNRYVDINVIYESYNPRTADPIKAPFKGSVYDEDILAFWKGWAKMGIKHPGSYISSILNLNIPYWYLGADSIDIYSKCEYIEVTDYQRSEETSLAPHMLNFYQKFASYELMHKYPILGIVFSITTPFWLLLISLFILLFRKRKNMIPVLFLGLGIWISLLGAPLSNFRYVFCIVLSYPIILLLTFGNFSVKQNGTNNY